MHSIIEHELDASVREDPEQSRHVALQQSSGPSRAVDVPDRLPQTLERSWSYVHRSSSAPTLVLASTAHARGWRLTLELDEVGVGGLEEDLDAIERSDCRLGLDRRTGRRVT